MLRPIDPSDLDVATRIVEIQRAAYAIEADLMGFDGIPQLAETHEEVQGLGHMLWVGSFVGDRLVGLIAWEQGREISGMDVEIDRLAVDPARARQGVGRSLVRSVPTIGTTAVSTGEANTPAVSLYLSEGFKQVGLREVAPGIRVAQFRRSS